MLSLRPFRKTQGKRRARRWVGRGLEQLEGRALLTSAAFAVTSDWGTGFGGQVTVTNTQSTAVKNWTLAFTWDRSITQIWDGTIISHVGNQYRVTNAGWNSTIAANGGTAEFGFNASPGNVGSDVPTNYVLNGTPLGTSPSPTPTPTPTPTPSPTPTPTPSPTPTPTPTLAAVASFADTSDWGTGFGGQITISNTKTTPISNWSLAFTWDRTITQIWDGTITSHVGNQYVITNAGYNATITGNGSAGFGFNGSPGNVGTDVPTNYVLNGVALGAGVPGLSINNVSVNDGTSGNNAVFTVTLSQAATTPITVSYGTANGTAHAGTDFTATSGTLTFSPGTLLQTISVPINADTTAKANETFQVNLSNPSGAALVNTSGIATIVDTVGAAPTPPLVNNVSTQTLEGTAQTLNPLSGASDPDGYTLSLASYTQPAHGTVTENTNGALVYTPAASYLGADSFTFTVSDGHGETAAGTVSVTVVAPSTGSNWPASVFAPYVDMTLYPTYNLVTAMQSAGLKYFTLAFITADSNNAPAWGGYSSYEVNGGAFDQSIHTEISQVRQLGGDVSVSFGGENGQELAQAITSVSALTAAYQKVITAYGLTHIDFDIEGGAVADPTSIDRRSQAIAALQQTAVAAGKTLDVSFTLPVLPTGLTSNGLYVLQSALKYGVKISTVNVMAMDYGDSAAPNPQGQMGTYAIDAGQSVYTQLSGLYGTTLSTSQLYGMIGVSPMIGVNDASDEVLEPSDASQLVAWAEKVGLGELSFWSLGRDQEDPNGALSYAEDDSSSLVQTPYEFSDIFNAFTG